MLTNEELEFRRGGIGGSDTAAVCGVSKYKTRLDVYLEKIGLSEPFEGNSRTYWGNIHEKSIIEEYKKLTGNDIDVPESYSTSKNYEYILGKADGIIVGKNALLECKTSDSYELWGEQWTSQIPWEYYMQCAHYAYIYDVDYVDIAVLIVGNDFRLYRYDRNISLERKMVKIEVDFWENYVQKDIAPEPVSKKDIEKIYKCSDSSIIADENISSVIHMLASLNNKKKEIDKQINIYKDQIAVFMKDAQELVTNDGNHRVTYKSHLRKSIDTTLIKKAHPEIVDKFTKETEVRPIKLY